MPGIALVLDLLLQARDLRVRLVQLALSRMHFI